MKIAVHGQTAAVEVIRELLSPWNVSFTSLDEAEIVIIYKEKPLETRRTIVLPSNSVDFIKWVKDMKSQVMRKFGEQVFVAASSKTVLTISPRVLYSYDGLVKSAHENNFSTLAEIDEKSVLLALDIVAEYNRILSQTLDAKPSDVYRLLTSLPVSYSIAPKRLRDFLMRKNGAKESLTLCDKLPLDALRFILVNAIEKLSERKLQRKTWNGKRYVYIITHDVETQKGLQRAKSLKKLEEKYDVPSAWYIPSKRYKLRLETIKELANYGEIGCHDTKHDGKLAQLPKQKLIERLLEAKRTLGKISGQPIEGFRAPVLQHNTEIMQALEEAGYSYDTSIPTWEPKHPYTMKPHGIATTYLLTLEGVTEMPITLPQDHQLLHVLGLNPKEVVREWIKMINTIKEIGGLCTLLIHPDYKLVNRENLSVCEDLLNAITYDNEALVTLPTNITALAKPYAA